MKEFKAVKGVPWEPITGSEGIEVMSKVVPPAPAEVPPIRESSEKSQNGEDRKVEKKDVGKYGISPGCPGCIAISRGHGQGHTRNVQEKWRRK